MAGVAAGRWGVPGVLVVRPVRPRRRIVDLVDAVSNRSEGLIEPATLRRGALTQPERCQRRGQCPTVLAADAVLLGKRIKVGSRVREDPVGSGIVPERGLDDLARIEVLLLVVLGRNDQQTRMSHLRRPQAVQESALIAPLRGIP